MSKFRTLWRRVRTIAWTALTLVTLTAAVVVGVGKLLMPYSQRYQPQLEAWMSREFNQPVHIDHFTGEWKAFGPRISLEGLNLLGQGGGEGVIAIERAALDIKPLNVLLPGRPLYSFRIIGADLALVRDLEGRYKLSGLGVGGRDSATGAGDNDGMSGLARLGEVVLEQGRLSFEDEQRNIHLRLVKVNGRLQLDGRDMAVQVEASVADGDGGRVLGELGATMAVRLDRQQKLLSAQWQVETGDMSLAELASQWPNQRLAPTSGWLNVQLWGAWERGEAQRIEGVLDIRDASLETATGPLLLDHLNTRFGWRFTDRYTWRIDLSDMRIREGGREWSSPRLAVERNLPGNLGIWVSADYLEVGFPLQLTQHLMGLFNARWPRNVPLAASGQMHDFHILIDAKRQFAGAAGRFDNLAISDWGRWPKVAGLSGTANLALGEGEIQFSGQQVQLEWEGNFRAPALVDIPACHLEVVWSDTWQVDANDCSLQNEAIALSGRSRFAGRRGVPGKPSVDINLLISRAQIAALHDYWPERVIKPNVSNWLRRALQGGSVHNGRFLLQGDLDDFPFRAGQGMLDARVEIQGATLAFHPTWPTATGVDAVARFQRAGMFVDGSIAAIGGAAVTQVTARIADFKAPRLEIEYASDTSLPELVGFIRSTPLLDKTRLDLDRFQFAGAARTAGKLLLPLGSSAGQMTVEGRVDLAGNQFAMAEAALELQGISGAVDYDREGFRAEKLQASWKQQAARMELEADWTSDELFTASLEGQFPVTAILEQAKLGEDPMLKRLSGDTDWRAQLSVTRSGTAGATETWLQLDSDLAGVQLDLPAPLAKSAELHWPMQLHYPIEAAEPVLRIELQDRASLRMATGGGLSRPERANLHFGPGMGGLPEGGKFTVSGQCDSLDLDEWLDVVVEQFAVNRFGGALQFDSATVQAGELILLNRPFADVALTASYQDQVLAAEFTSTDMAGSVRYNRTLGQAHSLAADFDRLHLPAPVEQGVTKDTDPSRLPEMHIYVRDFKFQDLQLGETRIEAFPQGNGLRIESVEAVTGQMNFQARGDWLLVDGAYRSDFDMVLTAESLGALVTAMNLSSVLEGGQTMVRYDAWWPGPPAAFAMAVLNGEMQINVIDGRLLTADPGAGRVLGLISVAALPRRLALDFRDVFESGFGFDQARGTVQLENGTARTNDFVLESTAATLSINGASDLVNKTFDYQLSVRPGVSQALPVIGAIAAGPGGAAAGLALQGLLRQALGDATEARYRISGPWAQPEVTRIEVAPASTGGATEEAPKQDAEGND